MAQDSERIGKVSGRPGSPRVCESKNTIKDESGYLIQLDEIAFNQIDLKWGSYINPKEKVLSFHPDKTGKYT